MTDNFEQILQDNYCLKKSLALTRNQNEKLQQELSEMRFNYQELLDKNTDISHTYNQLLKKNQLQSSEYNKDLKTLTSQIEELKMLIEQKQLELENFQIRMIPNLDQQMVRVKLVAQMEGPYQQAVDKKDKEIDRLREKMAEIERKYNVAELQNSTKEKEFKRQIEETKNFYQHENQQLLKELNLQLNRKEVKSYDKEVFRNQRKELEELRYTIDLQSKNQLDLRKQLTNLKLQREKLLQQICELNEKKALQLHFSTENSEIRALKEERKRMEEDLQRRGDQITRLEKKIKALERQFKANEEEAKRSMQKTKQLWQNEKENLTQNLRKEKEENRRLRELKEKRDDDRDSLGHSYKTLERELQLKKTECIKLKQKVEELERANRQLELSKKKKLSLTKDIVNDRYNETHKKQNDIKKINEDKSGSIKELQKIIEKLKEKLGIANKKIMQLLKEKGHNVPGNSPTKVNDSRDRAFSNIQIGMRKPQSDKAFLLEYRDISFIPLVPPTVFTYQHKR